jgi:HK97 family phage major capsid protein
MPDIKDLATKISETWEEMKKKNDLMLEAAQKGEAIHAEDKAAMDRMNADMTAFKKQLDDMALREARTQVVKPGEKTSQEDTRDRAYKSAFFKWIRKGTREMANDDLVTLRNALPPERKALVGDTTGAYLIPEDLEAEILRAVPQINTIRNYCRVRPTSRDKVGIRSLTEVSVGWGKLETGTAITESTPTPSKDTIYVEDLYGLTKVGEDELDDTDANLAAILADSFSVAIANEEAKQFAVGRGHTSYSEPDGVAVDATILASYKRDLTTADTMIPDDVIKTMYALGSQYKTGSVLLMNKATELALRVYRPAVASGYYGPYLWQPSLLAGQPNNFDGFPVVNQDDMHYAADAVDGINVIFGNFRLGYMILERQGLMLQRLNELYAEAGLVGFKVHKRVGGGVIRPAAFYGLYNET